MLRLTWLLLLTFVFAFVSAAQTADLRLEWDPAHNIITGSVDLRGTANVPDQQFFYVEAAQYDPSMPETDLWTPIVLPPMAAIVDGEIGAWHTAVFPDGLYQVRLHAINSAQENFYYVLAPIAINNDGQTMNSVPVQVIENTAMTVTAEDMPAEDESAGAQMIPAPQVENRLPIPVGGHVLHFGDAAKAAMKSAGMTWVKWQIPYFEGTDLTVARDRINWSHEAGFLVLLSVTGEKHALAEGGDAYLDEYAKFLGGVAGLGADAIEVWNEMNIDREWPTGQIDPRRYKVMLEKAYTQIKAANPDTIVITGALAPTGAEGAFGLAAVWNDDRYYWGMANAGVAEFADCIGAHYNEGILPPTSQGGDPRDEYPTRYLPLMLQRVAFPFRNFDIPMCMTEMGYLSPEGYGRLPDAFNWAAYTSVQEQARWLADAIQISANFQRMPVEMIIVWNIDFESYDNDPQAGYAIIRPDGSCPACETIAALQR